ncbi:MAG TPA: carbamoyltransferase HypF [Pseudomonadales bacterium]|nr:carbamoyltransferase HypF [Pseudomonadales bacterium]
MTVQGWRIHISGRVQGVGFRPAVWRLAQAHSLSGCVSNGKDGLLIKIYGPEVACKAFIESLTKTAPSAARIENIACLRYEFTDVPTQFVITESENDAFNGAVRLEIPPDFALCSSCKQELFDSTNRRFGHPFIHCTDCGPRFSIIERMPYERANTTMAAFVMCAACQAEYNNPSNRRFYYQAICCPHCGPALTLLDCGGTVLEESNSAILKASSLIKAGYIVAIKGIGGFNLVADAGNAEVVSRLRQRKNRPHKALALMASDVAMVAQHAFLSESERNLLQSAEAPIVLLRKKKSTLPDSIAPGLNRLGFILPYTALHHLLLQHFATPLVFTSANASGEPTCVDADEVLNKLASICDYVLTHNRAIAHAVDDSVVQVYADDQMQMLRAGRGWLPSYISVPDFLSDTPDILAMGAQIKSAAALLHKRNLMLAAPLNDLSEVSTFKRYKQQCETLVACYDAKPKLISTDLHPNYQSTLHGKKLAERYACPVMTVQHHHAHLAACLLEQTTYKAHEKVLGLALDGTGLGSDLSLWGAEFLLFDLTQYERLARFKPVFLPGASQAIRQPWRSAYAYLRTVPEWSDLLQQHGQGDLLDFFEQHHVAVLEQMIVKNINSPLCSSAGRLFDAVAALLNICRSGVSYEGQAAMELEALAEQADDQHDKTIYPCEIRQCVEPWCIDWSPLWPAMLADMAVKLPPAQIALRFHNSVIQSLYEMIGRLQARCTFSAVALSGGVFQNQRLLTSLLDVLREDQLKVYMPNRLPCNDGGLAAGQALVCAAHYGLE